MNPTVMTCSLSNLSQSHSLTSLSIPLLFHVRFLCRVRMRLDVVEHLLTPYYSFLPRFSFLD